MSGRLAVDDAGWCRGARRVPSPNHDARPEGAVAELLVIHHISLPPGRFSGDAIERLFTNTLDCTVDPSLAGLDSLRVSAHFLVRRRGELLQFVPTTARAWHAGASSFQGRERCNDFSIGIELEGTGERRYTDAQYRVLGRLTHALAARHPLKALAGHSDIAPGRKTDPGPSFDWSRYVSLLDGCGLVRPFQPDSRTGAKVFP
ncbi:MAG: 1,6-anhydro-N-acetylmuramyl-L-alanine amidase AmpD [Burkholderiales bacterium]